MYQKVLVPLDGSQLAECTLQHIKNLAKDGAIGEVILLNAFVVELPLRDINLDDGGLGTSFDFMAFRKAHQDKSKKYLAALEARLAAEGIKVKTESIETNKPAKVIIDYAQTNGVGLIVMATHGHSGVVTLMLGSVAFRVLHESPIPVLLIRPESCRL